MVDISHIKAAKLEILVHNRVNKNKEVQKMAVLHLNEEGFRKLLDSQQPMLVDFWAGWCGPCKMLAPVIEELAAQYEGKVTVAKVDVDDQQELAIRYGIMSIPTVVFFQKGNEVDRKVGLMPKDAYCQMVDAHL